MNLFEFEGKRLLSGYGIKIPKSQMVLNHNAAPIEYPLVLKAQTLSGGRGKAGGVRVCCGQEDFTKNCGEIMELKVKGNPVCGLMAEQAVKIQRELYLAITLQGSSVPKLIACGTGGMEIESLAKSDPDKLFTAELDPFTGLSSQQTDRLISFLGLEEQQGARELLKRLQDCFFGLDALLVEINPLGIVDGELMALDAKIELDNNAKFRHEDLFEQIRRGRTILKNYQEKENDGTTITFVPLDGDIGLISDGAGTGMLTLDLLCDMGGKVASFCELGGTTPASTMYKAMEYTLNTGQKLKSLLVVLIGGFNRMDDMANGIVAYISDHGLNIPIFVRMVGNMEEAGKQIMADAGLKTYSILTEAVADAVAAAERGKDVHTY